ncbi:MAG: winged helix-turn-helix domain-containing protein [Gammaproteobacteria bacterium]
MDQPTAIPLRIGAWCVNPAAGQMSREGEVVRLEARTLRLLLCLAQHAGQVVSIDALLDQVWSGAVVTPDSVYQAVASLRRMLGDDARQPAYIATVPRLGYRMVASVSAWEEQPVAAPPIAAPLHDEAPVVGASAERKPRSPRQPLLLLGATLCFVLAVGAFLLYGGALNSAARSAPAKSVAVLPFLDLTTQEMNEEYFADGMTEELIDRLSRIPGLRVPAPTASFYFKGKQTTVAEAASSLGVTFVVDGSVRKSGDTLRIAARLIRAADGYVVWSGTYDRASTDRLRVQDEIAGEVAKALPASIR